MNFTSGFLFQSVLGVGDHTRPIEYQWIRNGTGIMVRNPPYSFKRLGWARQLQTMLNPRHNVLQSNAAIFSTAVHYVNALLAVTEDIIKPHQLL